jgi:hypothetical protein
MPSLESILKNERDKPPVTDETLVKDRELAERLKGVYLKALAEGRVIERK